MREVSGVHRKVDFGIKLLGDAVIFCFGFYTSMEVDSSSVWLWEEEFSGASYRCNEKGYCPFYL